MAHVKQPPVSYFGHRSLKFYYKLQLLLKKNLWGLLNHNKAKVNSKMKDMQSVGFIELSNRVSK